MKIFWTNKTDFSCSFQNVISTTDGNIYWPKKSIEIPSVSTHVVALQYHTYTHTHFTNFTREPCKFGNRKKKTGADGISIAIAIEKTAAKLAAKFFFTNKTVLFPKKKFIPLS